MTGKRNRTPWVTTPARYSEIIVGDIPLSFFEIIQELSWMNYGDFWPISVYVRYPLPCVKLALPPVSKAYDLNEKIKDSSILIVYLLGLGASTTSHASADLNEKIKDSSFPY